MADFAQQLKAKCSYFFQRATSFSFGNNKENKGNESSSSTVASVQTTSAVTLLSREIITEEKVASNLPHVSEPPGPEHH